MKKILAIILASVLAMTMLTSCGKKDTTTDTSLEDIKAKGKIVMGMDDQFPPMGFRDEKGELVGFDVDLAKAVATKLGVEVEFKPINWASKELELDSKSVDVLWNGYSITEERAKKVLFSKAYLSSSQSIITRPDSGVKDRATLAGKKIGLQDGSTSEKALKKDKATYESVGEDNISRYTDNLEALLDLEAGRLDAVIMDEVVARYQTTLAGDKFVVLDDSFEAEDYGVGFRKNDKSFCDAVNKAIEELKADGTAEKISKQWLGGNFVK